MLSDGDELGVGLGEGLGGGGQAVFLGDAGGEAVALGGEAGHFGGVIGAGFVVQGSGDEALHPTGAEFIAGVGEGGAAEVDTSCGCIEEGEFFFVEILGGVWVWGFEGGPCIGFVIAGVAGLAAEFFELALGEFGGVILGEQGFWGWEERAVKGGEE
ncbi:MAG: hypothetical protein RI897_4012 [Verrucomicrobiota bacterium]